MLLLALVLLPACGLTGGDRHAATTAMPERPNILFILSDDQRADAVGAHGNPHIRTPNLDRLVHDGFRFDSAYCMGSIHGAVCQPSRAMLMSGRSLYRTHMRLEGLPILPELLRGQEYQTFGTGKWHNARPSFVRGFETGRRVFFGGMSNHLEVPVVDLLPDGGFSDVEKDAGYSTEIFTDAAIEFLEQADDDRPWFVSVSYTTPHDPRMPPEEALAPYRENPPPLPPNFAPQHPFHTGWMTGRDEALAPWPRPAEMIRDQLAEYYGMITHMDTQVGRLLAALEENGHADDTIVIFTSDHGLAMGSHGLLGKQNLYEHSTRSPMIIQGPDIPHGESDALVYLFDLFPTVLGLCGVTVPEGAEGMDLGPLWRGEEVVTRDALFTTYEDSQRAVRDERWKLIRYPKIHRNQLFDLVEDPHEMNDLADDPAQKERVKAMLTRMRALQEQFDDEAPLHPLERRPAEVDLTGRKRQPDGHQPEWIVEKYFGGGSP